MIIAKQMEIRDNIKKYFDFAHDVEPIIVPRKQNKNVVIISESEYNRLNQALRMAAYSNSLSTQSGKTADDNTLCSDIKSENLNKLEKISGLKENWNCNGASPFSKTVIKKARALIKALLIQPEVFPTALNTIQFEYDNSRHDHLEIEIGESDTAEVFFAPYDGKETIITISSTAAEINRRVSEFYG